MDLEYAFALTNPQPLTLLQTGDIPEGAFSVIMSQTPRVRNVDGPDVYRFIGASFNNWLDAVDASFCTFEGGDDPTQVCTEFFKNAM